MVFNIGAKIEKNYPLNDEIRSPEVHLILADGTSAGVVTLQKAKDISNQENLDLVEIGSSAKPPVVKLMDYNKFAYTQSKQAKKSKAKSNQLKEVRLSLLISDHDINTKADRAKEFLSEGHFVRAFINLRGRENIFAYKAKEVLAKFGVRIEATVEQPVNQVGKRLQVIFKPGKPKDA